MERQLAGMYANLNALNDDKDHVAKTLDENKFRELLESCKAPEQIAGSHGSTDRAKNVQLASVASELQEEQNEIKRKERELEWWQKRWVAGYGVEASMVATEGGQKLAIGALPVGECPSNKSAAR